ncbi:hypothetical protein NSB25_13880 [Acetatifactor muris]|uniref:Capsular polysaccharide biosynthesis protein n=1 Tax=Acetatifactor muris TaxID=879566 RepID=A0A2K4ZI68_9FIRM|nr:hypothetical protein [Acetatifactor muris]MCR2048379.1 hypothetical protein [Acetatifactor muris]SOY30183.1 hypothetical protein AMURIS_02906 [Acetatifactor muris]
MRYYGKEPFDLKLTILRMLYRLPVIGGLTILGTLLFGGGYYVKNVLLQGPAFYQVVSVYRVEYDVQDEKDVGQVYINQATWTTYIRSGMFLEHLQAYLAEDGESGVTMSEQELAEALGADLASDLRIPSTIVTTDDPEKSMRIAAGVEAVMTGALASEIREIKSIHVVDPGDTAVEVVPDVRVGRALILSAVLSCFFAVIIFLLKETGDDSIWLPASLWRRYGLKTAGTPKSGEFAENMKYFFRGEDGKGKGGSVAVCPVQEKLDGEEVLEMLKASCLETVGEGWFAVQSPVICPEVCERLREAEGILLAVKAGSHAGRKLEHVLEYLEQQDCRVTAAVLWGADERLIRRYYRLHI